MTVPRLVIVLAITAASTAARAHVAPSVDDNNRYLKLTPLGDRVRLAYTILFGEVPGANARKDIDTDRDGTISDAEARAFADTIGKQVAAEVVLEIDGVAQPIAWASVDAGMGTPVVAAGAFSIDLVVYACLPRARGRHRVTVHDRFRVPSPGEVELIVEDSPDVAIERAHVGPIDDPAHDFRFAGPGGPLADDGLELVFVAGERAPVARDGTCVAARDPDARPTWWGYAVGGALGGVVLALVLALRQRRRRRPA